MTGLHRVQLDGLPIVQENRESVVIPDPLDSGEVTGANAVLPIGGRELDALAYRQVALLFSVDRALLCLLLDMYRVVRHWLSVSVLTGEHMLFCIPIKN